MSFDVLHKHTETYTITLYTIEMCGGSRKLLKVLNFGAVSSPDTHDCFVTDVATHQRNKTVWDDLSDQILASVHNFDMLQSHLSRPAAQLPLDDFSTCAT